MAIYTIVGWLLERHRGQVDHFNAGSARQAIDAARQRAFDRATGSFSPDWRLVIAVPGKRLLAARYESIAVERARAAAQEAALARAESRETRVEWFTPVGFWRHSMETIHRPGQYGSADESVLQVLAELGRPDEIQMVGAFADRVPAEMRRESLPRDWDVLAPLTPARAARGRARSAAS
jgi:hypothetical protein